jgi:vacuolar iron transporter family protein
MDKFLQKTLLENWRREIQAAKLYALCAKTEPDHRKKQILMKLAEVERQHARLWTEKLAEMGVEVDDKEISLPQVDISNRRELLFQIEKIEDSNGTWYESQRNVVDDPDIIAILDQIDIDERNHGDVVSELSDVPANAKGRLKHLWGTERWHKNTSGGWVGDAIYGVNDGLGAIFGIIAGVAGYTNENTTILVSGLFGALASTLSMGAGAWLAAKSENELMEFELHAERKEIEESPEHEIEELGLLYELKGFESNEAAKIARRIATDKEAFLKTMAQEELGIHETSRAKPWRSAIFGSISTLVGAIIPLIPFFFMQGTNALITAAIVSIVAHFAVGALKSKMTVRSWWASGLEMMWVGILVGSVSYGLGEIGAVLLG